MDEKIINSFEVESNNEVIKINTIQTDKGIRVEIEGKTMDVLINGEEFYSKYDQEEYKFIPKHIRPFIEKHLENNGDITKEDNHVQTYVVLDGIEFYTEISTKRAKNNTILFRDWLYDYKLIEENEDIKIESGKEDWRIFNKRIEDLGGKIIYSHNSDAYDNYYNLVFTIEDFTEEKVLKCIEVWKEYRSLFDKYELY